MHLLYIRHCLKCLPHIDQFNPWSDPVREGLAMSKPEPKQLSSLLTGDHQAPNLNGLSVWTLGLQVENALGHVPGVVMKK